jgi:ribosomal protein S21
MELEEWSLVNLKEWRQQQFGDKMHETRQGRSREAVKKQRAAKRKLMRALRHHDTGYEAMEE